MKYAISTLFGLIFSASYALAGNCAKHNDLEAMSCQIGYTWDDEVKECVQAPQA